MPSSVVTCIEPEDDLKGSKNIALLNIKT